VNSSVSHSHSFLYRLPLPRQLLRLVHLYRGHFLCYPITVFGHLRKAYCTNNVVSLMRLDKICRDIE